MNLRGCIKENLRKPLESLSRITCKLAELLEFLPGILLTTNNKKNAQFLETKLQQTKLISQTKLQSNKTSVKTPMHTKDNLLLDGHSGEVISFNVIIVRMEFMDNHW